MSNSNRTFLFFFFINCNKCQAGVESRRRSCYELQQWAVLNVISLCVHCHVSMCSVISFATVDLCLQSSARFSNKPWSRPMRYAKPPGKMYFEIYCSRVHYSVLRFQFRRFCIEIARSLEAADIRLWFPYSVMTSELFLLFQFQLNFSFFVRFVFMWKAYYFHLSPSSQYAAVYLHAFGFQIFFYSLLLTCLSA